MYLRSIPVTDVYRLQHVSVGLINVLKTMAFIPNIPKEPINLRFSGSRLLVVNSMEIPIVSDMSLFCARFWIDELFGQVGFLRLAKTTPVLLCRLFRML